MKLLTIRNKKAGSGWFLICSTLVSIQRLLNFLIFLRISACLFSAAFCSARFLSLFPTRYHPVPKCDERLYINI